MALWRPRRWFGQTRRGLRALDRMATALEQQTTLLTRLADTLAPLPPQTTDLAETGVTFLNETEHARIQDYVLKTTRETGRMPTDEEIVRWLADEATAAAIRERP